MAALPSPHPVLPLGDLPYQEQLARREERVRSAFAHAGVEAVVRPIVPSPRVEGARARVQVKVAPDGELGFHEPRTHRFVPAALSPVARPELVEAAAHVEAVLRDAAARGLPGGLPGEIELRTDGERVVVGVDRRPPVHPRELGEHVSIGDRRLWGDPTLTVLGLRISPSAFYQVNLEVNALVVDAVDALLQALAPTHLLDLYAGVGNLSARAVGRGTPATLVENDGPAAKDARRNLPAAEVLTKDASTFAAGSRFFDVAVLDPPRAGAPGLLPKLLLTRPRAIVYLSCDPTTLARDVKPALAAGYHLDALQPFDMFPGTLHVETLAVLRRG